MCNFLSGIVLKNGDLLWNPYTDSHEDLVVINNLRDKRGDEFARVEFSPPDLSQMDKPDTYKLKLDQERTPDWWTAKLAEKISDNMRGIVRRMIISGDATMLCGGAYILTSGAKISTIKHARLLVIMGSAQVDYISGSAQVTNISGSAKVGNISGSAKVDYISGSAQVTNIYGSAQVDYISGSAKVDYISGSAKVGNISDSAKVDYISGSAKIINDKRAK